MTARDSKKKNIIFILNSLFNLCVGWMNLLTLKLSLRENK